METETQNQMWQKYRSKTIIEATPYIAGQDWSSIGLCKEYIKEYSVSSGDFITRVKLESGEYLYPEILTKEELEKRYELLLSDTEIEADFNELLPTRTCNVGDDCCQSCQ